MQRRIVKTADGSDTIAIDDLSVSYHSKHGALQESTHVFIDAGLKYYHSQYPECGTIKIFEMGLGTGLNFLLSNDYASKSKVKIDYTAIEKYPLSDNEIKDLNYAELLNEAELFDILHSMEWGKYIQATDGVRLHKVKGDLEGFGSDELYDVIYYDAFAPNAQPELWTVDVFKKLYGMMTDNAILVTYCSKSDVRRAMISAGFEVEKLQGPPGKREMLRALKVNN